MQPPYTPEYIAQMEAKQAEMQAQVNEFCRQADEAIKERLKSGELDPADLPQPGEGPNHYFIRRVHEQTCSCATDPAKCYPHTHGKEAKFREK